MIPAAVLLFNRFDGPSKRTKFHRAASALRQAEAELKAAGKTGNERAVRLALIRERSAYAAMIEARDELRNERGGRHP